METLIFTDKDIKILEKNKLTTESVIKQYEFIKNNQHYTKINEVCDSNKVVLSLTNLNKNELNKYFQNIVNNNGLIKFVPASGASSRMFAFLIKYYHYLVDENAEISEKELNEVEYFFENLEKFSFFYLLPHHLINEYLEFRKQDDGTNSKKINPKESEKLISLRYSILHELLFDSNVENEISGLNYANEAKGNIKFHKLDDLDFTLNAFETHILEHFNLSLNKYLSENNNEPYNNKTKINVNNIYQIFENLIPIEFSINEDIYNHYIKLEKQNIKYEIYDNLSNIVKLINCSDIDIITLSKLIDSKVFYSKQDKSSNSVAFDENLKLVRKENGEFVTRAGGHGTLILNIQDINQDFIFVKNIDNVTKTSLHNEIIQNTKDLIGYTKLIKDKVDLYLQSLNKDTLLIEKKFKNENDIYIEISNFVKTYFIEDFNYENYSNIENLKSDLKNILDRPLRVVAVVKNTGEPGGGPFYINLNDKDKQEKDIFSKFSTKQIIELSQIDISNEQQAELVMKSKYFNPVFMVLNFKNYNCEKYNLVDFMSENMAMVVEKNYGAKLIKSYEYPGLWNGAMAYWNTIFVELPSVIFHPVKTVNDLLKAGHLD